MKLQPLDIKRQQFARGFRGYDPAEVDAFLKQVADQQEELANEVRQGGDRIRELEGKLKHYERVELALQEALESARETGRRSEAAAEESARLVTERAEMRAQEILRDAERDRYGIRQDILKLTTRQAEVGARLRGFLLSELEILAQFQGDDPVGFLKLESASTGQASSQGVLPAARPEDDAPPPDERPEASATPEPDSPEEPSAPATTLEDPEVPAHIPASDLDTWATHAERPDEVDTDASEPAPGETAPDAETAPEAHGDEPEAGTFNAAQYTWAPPEAPTSMDEPAVEAEPEVAEPAVAEPEATAPSAAEAAVLDSWAAAPADWATPTELPPMPEASDATPAPSSEGAPASEAPAAPAGEGWNFRSLVTGPEENVAGSEAERERIRRILDDLD